MRAHTDCMLRLLHACTHLWLIANTVTVTVTVTAYMISVSYW